MGFFSYECKHCDHSILSPYSADPEINEWMKDAVVLSFNGSRIVGEYGGYGDIGGMDSGDSDLGGDAVWLHQACWEVAGKPEYEHFQKLTEGGTLVRRKDHKRFSVVRFDADRDEAILTSDEDEQVVVRRLAEDLYATDDREVFELRVGSASAEDQGFFFGREHDMIDPRITDEAERERLLTEGVEKRERRWYDDRARKVAEWLDTKEREYHDEDKQKEPWRHRYSYFETAVRDENDEKGQSLKDGTNWYVSDGLDPEADEADEARGDFKGTEDELKADLSARWARFIESDECKAYLARRKVLRDEALREEIERLKAKGRYEVSYGPAPKGDTVRKKNGRDWVGGRTIYRVEDRLTYETVVKMEGPNKALGVKVFMEDPDYDGNNSPEWEARLEDIRAADREGHRLASEEAQRLNDEWARTGYPVPEDRC
jgi:hypothetical protein